MVGSSHGVSPDRAPNCHSPLLSRYVSPVVQYARESGLTLDYSSKHPLDFASPNGIRRNPTAQVSTSEPCEISSPAVHLLNERLTISVRGKHVLRNAFTSPSDCGWDLSAIFQRRGSASKLETPLLMTDNEHDLLHFGSKKDFKLSDTAVSQVHPIDRGSKDYTWTRRCTEQAQTEKLGISQESVELLKKVFDIPISLGVSSFEFDSTVPGGEPPCLTPMTPPLLSLSEEVRLLGTPIPEIYNHKLSDSIETGVQQAKALEAELLAEDVLTAEDNLAVTMMLSSEDSFQFSVSSSAASLKRTLSSLNFGIPPSPPLPSTPLSKRAKSTSFSDTLHQYAFELPSSFMSSDDLLEPTQGSDNGLKDELLCSSDETGHTSHKEKVTEADFIQHVKVPILPPITPCVSLKGSATANKKMCFETRGSINQEPFRIIGKPVQYLSALRKRRVSPETDDRLLRSPFLKCPDYMKLCESWPSSDATDKILSNMDIFPQETITSSDLAWNWKDVRVIEIDKDNEDDLEPSNLLEDTVCWQCSDQEMSSNLNGPFDFLTHSKTDEPFAVAPFEAYAAQRFSKPRLSPKQHHAKISDILEDDFDVSKELAAFMRLHGHSARIPSEQQAEPIGSETCLSASTSQFAIDMENKEAVQVQIDADQRSSASLQAETGEIMSFEPLTEQDKHPATIIIASALLKSNRSLVQDLTKLCPKTSIIERDFSDSGLRLTSRNVPHFANGDVPSAPPEEGDILLSSSTSIIVTTIQKIKQRPLPGQALPNGDRQRISSATHKFEHLQVLVSEGTLESQRVSSSLDERDAAALSDLQAFVAELGTGVQLHFVPGGSKNLAAWIANVMCSHRHELSKSKDLIIPEEVTDAEIFLRQAGLNTFAAQTVLQSLRKTRPKPEDINTRPEQRLFDLTVMGNIQSQNAEVAEDLAGFLLMSPTDRIAKYAPMFRGTKVLMRVNEFLDVHFQC